MPETLRHGDHGRDVELLQRLLTDLRYDVGPIDGKFGDRTQAAVIRYKDDAELGGEEGVVDEMTWASLQTQFGPLDGLRAESQVDAFVADVFGTVNSSMMPGDRLAALKEATNARLVAAGCPPIEFEPHAMSGNTHGTFTWWEWTMRVNETRMTQAWFDNASTEDQSELVSTIYHEARHAEDFYVVCRILRGLHDWDAAKIHAETRIPLHVTTLAAADPIYECTLTNGPAFDWYESVFGSGKEARAHALREDGTYEEYRSLPEEMDPKDGEVATKRAYREYAEGDAPASARPVLRRGDMNDPEVRYLQQLLVYRGYSWIGVDGDFGEKTEDAVKAFQRSVPLTDDGVVGEKTWEALMP